MLIGRAVNSAEDYYFERGLLQLASVGRPFPGQGLSRLMRVASQHFPPGGGRTSAVAISADARKIGIMSPSASPKGPSAFICACREALLPVLAVLVLVPLPTCARAEAQETVAAVWKERELHFSYLGFMAVHPCHVLQNRIARVLNAVGARPDLRVTLSNCNARFDGPTVVTGDGANWPQAPSGSPLGGWPTVPSRDGANRAPGPAESGPGAYRRAEPRQAVEVQVRLSIPAEMTPEVIAELRADRKRRELIAQVTGDPLPLFDDPIAFAAERKVVTLSHETTGIEPADCELLQQMASGVFKTLGVRVIRRRYACDRISVSRIRPTLEAEALIPVAIRLDADGEMPALGDEHENPAVPEDAGQVPETGDADQRRE